MNVILDDSPKTESCLVAILMLHSASCLHHQLWQLRECSAQQLEIIGTSQPKLKLKCHVKFRHGTPVVVLMSGLSEDV
jgi:hypothetical protein